MENLLLPIGLLGLFGTSAKPVPAVAPLLGLVGSNSTLRSELPALDPNFHVPRPPRPTHVKLSSVWERFRNLRHSRVGGVRVERCETGWVERSSLSPFSPEGDLVGEVEGEGEAPTSERYSFGSSEESSGVC
jgi:hypothetical protein